MPTNPTTTKKPRSGYIPTLDGWRAIAIIAVIAFHDNLYHLGRFRDNWLHTHGGWGVDLFFAISGFLICSRLLDEEIKNGFISVKNFYIRRAFRILPPMLAYLIVIAVLGICHVIHVGRNAWIASLLFVTNYYNVIRHETAWSLFTNHFWSLSVEEHFYLLLPALLVLFPKTRKMVLAIVTLLFILWSFAHIVLAVHSEWYNYSLERTDVKIAELLFPAFLAVVIRHTAIRTAFVRWLNPWFVCPFILALQHMLHWVSPHVNVNTELVLLSFPFLIISTSLHPENAISRALEFAPLRAIGRISYSLYLWQQLFFIRDYPLSNWPPLHLFQQRPWNILASIVMAVGSYFLLEKPMIRLGHRFAPPATPGHRDLYVKPEPVL
jgi:peptidoglycan/LPS O-acetylase OafA/YrhL